MPADPNLVSAKRSTMSRRTRRSLFAVAGVLTLAIWLVLTAAEGYEPLHAWLHGGKIPVNDDCAVVTILHGKVDTSVVVVNVSVTPAVVFGDVLAPAPIFASVDYSLLPNRGPPSLRS